MKKRPNQNQKKDEEREGYKNYQQITGKKNHKTKNKNKKNRRKAKEEVRKVYGGDPASDKRKGFPKKRTRYKGKNNRWKKKLKKSKKR